VLITGKRLVYRSADNGEESNLTEVLITGKGEFSRFADNWEEGTL
jgi:hypothetical protein